MPADLKDRLDAAATENKRSLTAEIVQRLDASFLEVVRLPEELRRKIKFHADGQMHSVNEEILGMLNTLYPEIPQPDELLQEIDDLISRAEELERDHQHDVRTDVLWQNRISEHIGKLRERVVTLLSVEKADK